MFEGDSAVTFDSRKAEELAELLVRVQVLETELKESTTTSQWPPRGFYAEYYATSGFLLGLFGAAISLLVNVIVRTRSRENHRWS